MPFIEPTHCFDCGVYLMGGATQHKPECSIRKMVEELMPPCTCATIFNRKGQAVGVNATGCRLHSATLREMEGR